MLLILAIPPVTHYSAKTVLEHFLEVNTTLQRASLNLQGLQVSGHLNTKDYFELFLILESPTSALVTLHYDGDVNTFSKVATVELPYVATVLDATFTTQDRYLDLNATLLEGTLQADLSLVEWNYHYKINNVDLTSFRTQQHRPVANYASGGLSAHGEGIIEDPYTVTFNLQGEHLQLENNITSLISPDVDASLPFTLEINGSVGANNLSTQLVITSTLVDANASQLFYDFNTSTFRVFLNIINHQQEIAPVKNASLDFNGSIGNALNASYQLTVDNYRLKTKQLQMDFNTSDLTLDYKLSTLEPHPLNLQGDNVLFGDLSYGNGNLSLKIDSKAINSPILLALKENKLRVISNNINLASLQIMTNQEVIAKGNLSLEADADLSTKPLLWHAKVQSKDLQLPWRYRKDIGLTNNLNLIIGVKNEQNGDIVVHPTLWSNVGLINHTALRYKPNQEILYFNLNAKNINTSYYKVPKLNLRGALNLKESRLNRTTLKTSYEKVVINSLHYSDKGIKSRINFMLSRLDRFGRLSPEYKLHGETILHYSPQKTVITLDSNALGHLNLEQKGKVIKLSGDTLPVQEISALLNEPSIMHGNLDYTLRYTESSIKATVHSKQLRGDGELNQSVRPFELDFSTSLKYKDARYRGNASLETDNEFFKISNISVDLSKNQVRSRYELHINKLENNTFILPPELKGPLQLSGDFEQNVYQHLTLNLTDFKLPKEWHQKLEDNATASLETNASVEIYNDKGLINFNAKVTNKLLQLKIKKSDFNIKTGGFHFNSDLKTALWVKDTNFTTAGTYSKKLISLPEATLDTAHQTISLKKLQYIFKDENLTTDYSLHLKPYAHAPYHSKASIYGKIKTKPSIDVTMQSTSLGGQFDAHLSKKKFQLRAKNVSLVKLIKFSGQKVPISKGALNAKIIMHSPSLFDAELTTLQGQSDINITDMLLDGVELDSTIDTLRNSQDLNLFQGNLGDLPLVRSVKDIPSDLTSKEANSTHFGHIRFLTDVNKTGLHCSDCAIATEENFIVIKGGINLQTQTFNEMYVGMLFPNNCAYFIQQIDGNVSNPQVKLAAAGFKVIGGAAKSLVGNIGTVVDFGAGIIKKTGDAVGGVASYVPVVGDKTDAALTTITNAPKNGTTSMTECTPFYAGSINHPKQK